MGPYSERLIRKSHSYYVRMEHDQISYSLFIPILMRLIGECSMRYHSSGVSRSCHPSGF